MPEPTDAALSKAFGPRKMLLQTENKSVAELYADSIFGLIGIGATFR